jgi:hypothetical protein
MVEISVQQIADAGCGCTTLPHFAVRSAVIASPTLLPGPALAPFALLPVIAGQMLPMMEPCDFIGSPPPYLAAISHYTYLHTSVFLI